MSVFLTWFPGMQSACVDYIVICGLSALPHFTKLSQKTARFSGKKINEHKMCDFILPTNLSETLLILKKKPARYHKCAHIFMYRTCHSCHILNKAEISREIFERSVNIEFHYNPSREGRGVPYGRMDRRTDMTKLNSRFFQFCKRA
jgi:hypothetical protein